MVVKYSLVMSKRKYQQFQGNNKFYCYGRLMSARQIGIMVFCLVAIIVVACLFFAFDARFLVTNLHPIGVGVIFPFIALLGLFYSTSFLLKTGCIDPGIVPRSRPDEREYLMNLGNEDPTNTAKGFVGTAARYKTVVVNGQNVKLKWCATCNIWRPPRASHCGLCNNCYEHFDHHCPVVGNCVAKRNYRYFYLFVSTIFYMCLFVMGSNVAVIVLASKKMGFGNALKTYPASVIEFAICGMGAIAVSGLAFMHTWLIATMKTTNEDIKGTFNPRRQGVRNPYRRRNCCWNFMYVICGPFPPSVIDRRGFIDESLLMEEEAAGGYGATSSVPKLPPEAPAGGGPEETPSQPTQQSNNDALHSAPPVNSSVTEVELHSNVRDSTSESQASSSQNTPEDTQRLIVNST